LQVIERPLEGRLEVRAAARAHGGEGQQVGGGQGAPGAVHVAWTVVWYP
jgi:hypothetical protein